MNGWLSIRKEFPGLRGYLIHTLSIASDVLEMALSKRGFTIYVVDGSRISDERTFFSEVARALRFPDYFGHNWDAWSESLGDLSGQIPGRVGIIWRDADKTFSADPQTFLQAASDLYCFASTAQLRPTLHPEEGNEPRQVEIFFLGEASGFTTEVQVT